MQESISSHVSCSRLGFLTRTEYRLQGWGREGGGFRLVESFTGDTLALLDLRSGKRPAHRTHRAHSPNGDYNKASRLARMHARAHVCIRHMYQGPSLAFGHAFRTTDVSLLSYIKTYLILFGVTFDQNASNLSISELIEVVCAA